MGPRSARRALPNYWPYFRLEFDDHSVMAREIAGRPVYLAMAMTDDKSLRLKPQNLLVNLPLAERA